MSSNEHFFNSLEKEFEHLRQKRIVLVGGCFDILHFGHISFLQQAKKTGDFLVVALENDAFIHMQKKRKPFHTLQERIAILQEIRTVDSVISLPLLSGYEDYLKLVKAIHPSIIAVTENDPYLSQKSKQARAIQAQVKIVIGRIPQHATTSILKQL
ncbi:glycerol-3-phosphate cytidylyltransferase [Candidatus Roizmanbacteria bacterium CG10_big_fil_rev_8_21_14_0_10_39_6]|uniref:Glycerol-3-phosphate cytidylyltransferase n=1 Tax=Candidatus Roizmanbacteria bacterium CG10_big_fil_rev_8_21_14_0_10_39_6 TaxID=1974853 RepID=A0A2M8KST6_9BACT|nr:MAG: glycerol-3-phosphate cytidylyltransferase [Candidatus Roizmanbacteria bacterium CG10_big_fil_rev_8_21_14_0_10_39_6]